jgi:hypothetical protein
VHTAATYDGDTKTLKGYFNGLPNGSWSLGDQGLNVTLGGVHIGEFGGYRASASYVASVRIYNRVLSDSEIADLANEFNEDSSSSTESYTVPSDFTERWALQSDRNSTNHASDSAYTLERSTNASVSYGTASGMTGATVSGGSLYSLTNVAGSSANGFALSTWCKCSSAPTATNTVCGFVNAANSVSYGYWLGYCNGKYAVGTHQTTQTSRAVSTVSVDTSWHNLVANYDKDALTVDLWIDGVKSVTLTLDSTLNRSAGFNVNALATTSLSSPEGVPSVGVKYAYVTSFARTLTDEECRGMYHEFD